MDNVCESFPIRYQWEEWHAVYMDMLLEREWITWEGLKLVADSCEPCYYKAGLRKPFAKMNIWFVSIWIEPTPAVYGTDRGYEVDFRQTTIGRITLMKKGKGKRYLLAEYYTGHMAQGEVITDRKRHNLKPEDDAQAALISLARGMKRRFMLEEIRVG